jgi:hypothetical protein
VAITSTLTNQFKLDLTKAIHDFTNSGGTNASTFKWILVKSTHTGTYGADTLEADSPGSGAPSGSPPGTTGIGTDAHATTGGYNAVAGLTLVFDEPQLYTNTVVVHPTSPISVTATTISASGMLIYNSTSSNKVVACLSFGGTVATTNGTFAVTWPTKNGSTGMIRLA